MKKNLFKNAFVACVSFVLFIAVFSACQSNNNIVVNADKTKLNALIDSCNTLSTGATTANYPQAAITAFQMTLASVKTAEAVAGVTQSQVDNLVIQLRAAKTVFLAASFSAIPPAALTFALTFDEGTGTQLTTTGAKSWTAVLKPGPSQLGVSSLPTFVTGHKGSAIHFGLASHLEISNYTPADLLKTQMSISVWVKPDSTKGANYIISYNTYNTWKFQLQEQNKPFFTTHTSAGYTDADDQLDLSAPNGSWTHLVVSNDLVAGTMNFYVNGLPKMKWTVGTTGNTTKPNLSGTLVAPTDNTIPLLIGNEVPYVVGTDAPKSLSAFSYFVGALDNLEYYNIALTDGQVSSLYNSEK